jgi:hypothetical protein
MKDMETIGFQLPEGRPSLNQFEEEFEGVHQFGGGAPNLGNLRGILGEI